MRRRLDQYFTPEAAVVALWRGWTEGPDRRILEPCAGRGAISNTLRRLLTPIAPWGPFPGPTLITNDIDPAMPTDHHMDAASPEFWEAMPAVDFVVSNPPFQCAAPILEQAWEKAGCGMAMLLRLSYLEPCKERAQFLAEHPPSLLSLPRISFTGDGKTDNVSCAWFIWNKDGEHQRNEVVTREQLTVWASELKQYR